MNKTNRKHGAKISKGKLFTIVGSVAAVIIITVLVVVIVSLLQREPEVIVEHERIIVEPNVGGKGTLVTEDNLAEVLEELKKPVEDGSYSVKMNMNWHFPSSTEESTNAYVANSTRNKRTVYFDVILTGSNELVYSSPYLEVGAEISGFALDAALEAGEYEATVIYHLVDDDYNEITTASVIVVLTIEK